MFLVIFSNKILAILMNQVQNFLDKFAPTLCKRFPPYLNNVSTLPCESWNGYRAHATVELSEKGTTEFFPPQLRVPNSPYLI